MSKSANPIYASSVTGEILFVWSNLRVPGEGPNAVEGLMLALAQCKTCSNAKLGLGSIRNITQASKKHSLSYYA